MCHCSPRHSCPVACLQVDTTSGIAVGRWVRLFAQEPTAVAPPALRRLLSEEEEAEEGQPEAEAAIEIQLSAAAELAGIEAGDVDSLVEAIDDALESASLPKKLRCWLERLLRGKGTDEKSGRGRRHGEHGRKRSSEGSGGGGSGSGTGGSGVSGSADEGGEPTTSARPAANITTAGSPAAITATNGTAAAPANATAAPCADAPGYLALTETLREGCLDAQALGLGQPEEPAGTNSTNSTDGSGDRAPGLAAGGTLDAYVYGRVAGAMSGTGERAQLQL